MADMTSLTPDSIMEVKDNTDEEQEPALKAEATTKVDSDVSAKEDETLKTSCEVCLQTEEANPTNMA